MNQDTQMHGYVGVFIAVAKKLERYGADVCTMCRANIESDDNDCCHRLAKELNEL